MYRGAQTLLVTWYFSIVSVVSPCQGFICENGGKCTADFRNIPPSASCTCRSGFDGSHCATGTIIATLQHGYLPSFYKIVSE